MTSDDGRNLGSDEAHTPPISVDPERAAKVGSTRATTEAAMADLASQISAAQPEPEQQSLLLADPDETFSLFAGPVPHVAKIREDAKRARGRPAGSQNRRSNDLANYLLSMGYRDPALILADIANADPVALAEDLSVPYRVKNGPNKGEIVETSVTPDVALKLIKDAAAELLPYFHTKRPAELDVKVRTLGVMVIGDMKTDRADDGKVMDITAVPAPE